MKNYFEVFLTAILLTLMCLIIVVLVGLQGSIISAREVQADCWNAVETSELNTEADVTALENQLNETIHKDHSGWDVTIETLTSGTAREYYLVTLHYTIQVPLINVKTKGTIKSYAQ